MTGRVVAALIGMAVPVASQSLETQYADSTALFIGLFAVSPEVVWASGTGGRVARTTDGGATWTVMRVPGADSLQFRDVHAFSADEAFVLSIGNGRDSRIYHTIDGGGAWRVSFQNEDPNAFYDCLAFWDRDRGIAMSDSHEGEFTLLRTDDAGITWRRVPPDAVPDARPGEGAFAASGTCVVTRPGGLGWIATGASAVDARVLRTDDYGLTWTAHATPIPSRSSGEGLTSLAFLDDRVGLGFGGTLAGADSTYPNVMRTADGGRTWALTGGQALEGVVYGGAVIPGRSPLTAVAAGPAGVAISEDGGVTWRRISDRNTWSVTFATADAGWAVGRGHVSRFRFAAH